MKDAALSVPDKVTGSTHIHILSWTSRLNSPTITCHGNAFATYMRHRNVDIQKQLFYKRTFAGFVSVDVLGGIIRAEPKGVEIWLKGM